MAEYFWRRLRHVVIHRILHVDDTPHRIAMGVVVGLFVACSPLMGLHMLLALLLSVALRANRAVSVVAVWVSNPATFLPIISFNWVVGQAVWSRGPWQNPVEIKQRLIQVLGATEGFSAFVSHVFSVDFWGALLHLFWQLGAELWVGSALVGMVAAVVGYFVTRRAVTWRRRLVRLRREKAVRRRAARPEGEPVVEEEASEEEMEETLAGVGIEDSSPSPGDLVEAGASS